MHVLTRLVLIPGALLAMPLAAGAQAADTVSVRVEGQPMRVVVTGTGRPAIVLEAGAAADHRTWSAVQPLLARSSLVVSYDRFGHGESGVSPRPRTAAIIAEQLREALLHAGVEPPYLLVGHSFGGVLVRVFAARYPDEVAGMVLVDPVMEDFYPRAARAEPALYLSQLEEEIAWSDGEAGEGVRREFLAYETSLAQARVTRLPRGLPVSLISAAAMELPAQLRAIWTDEQRRWAARHARVTHTVVDHGHRIPQQRPEVIARAVE